MRAKAFTFLAVVLFLPRLASAQEPRAIVVDVGSSTHMRLGANIVRTSPGSLDVADVAGFPPDQLVVIGKRVGQTTATVWFTGDRVAIYQVKVQYPVNAINDALGKNIPEGKEVKVTSAGDSVILSGQVQSAAHVVHAESIVRGFIGEGQIVNLLTVAGENQVQLEVSFSEVSRSALKQVGINFFHKAQNGDYSSGMTSPQSNLPGVIPQLGSTASADTLNLPSGPPFVQLPIAGAFGAVFALGGQNAFPFSAALSILSQRGYARALSEPTLVALSGHSASFLAGGEFPVPIPQALGQVGVEYKKFGVQLQFTPTVVGNQIQLKLSTTVSDIDFSFGLRLAQVTVPGLTERHSETTVRLRDGESFAIAGLLTDRVRSNVDKIPGLGDIPVLGALFRSTSYRREETELLVVVTARLVRPQGERPLMPGEDMTTDPGDLELFLLGTIESKESPPRKKPSEKAKPVGRVGFARE